LRPTNSAPSPTGVALRVLLVVVIAAAGLWVLHQLGRVILLLVVTLFFAYLIAPLVDFARRPVTIAGIERRLSPALAIAIVYVGILITLSAGATIMLPRLTRQASQALSQAPVYASSLRAWEHRWAGYYDDADLPAEVRQSVDRSVAGAGDAAIEYARGSLIVLVGGLAYLPWLVLVPVLAFFVLQDADAFRRALLDALPPRLRTRGHQLSEDLNATFAAYIRGQILACALVGTLCGGGFALLGMPYPALLGVFAGILEFVPLVGPLLIATVAVVIAALQMPWLAVWVGGYLVIVRVVEDYVIYPRLIGRGVHLHPLAIVLAVLAGVELGGFTGVLVAVPFVALASVAVRHWTQWQRAQPVTQRGAAARSPLRDASETSCPPATTCRDDTY
jgi:predicted PurR-regulated permease PerM